jgi:ribosome recycling factor
VQVHDTYKEVKTIEFSGMVARVYVPELTEDERNHRMKIIHRAAAKLLMNERKEKR